MGDYQQNYGAYQGGDSTAYTSQSQPVDNTPQPQAPYAGSASFGNFNPQQSAEKAKDPKVLVRLLGWLFALISFACASAMTFRSESAAFKGWLVFVGVMAWLLEMFFISSYIIGDRFPPALASKLPIIEFILSVIWTLFWFAGATAYATKLNEDLFFGPRSTANAAVAFAYFAMITWGVSAYLAFKRFRESSGSSSLPYSSV